MDKVIHRDEALSVISDNVRQLLADRGWALRELARRSETHPMVLSHLIRKSRLPGIDAISRIAEAFEISVDDLLKKNTVGS